MKLDGAFAGAIDFKHAGRAIPVEGDFRVSNVVGENDIVSEAEPHRALKEVVVGNRRGRIVGIVEPHQLGSTRDLCRNCAQVGKESVLFDQLQEVGLASIEDAPREINRVARVWDEYNVAGIDDCHGEFSDSLLRADQRTCFSLRVQAYSKSRLVPAASSFAKPFESLIIGIAVIKR